MQRGPYTGACSRACAREVFSGGPSSACAVLGCKPVEAEPSGPVQSQQDCCRECLVEHSFWRQTIQQTVALDLWKFGTSVPWRGIYEGHVPRSACWGTAIYSLQFPSRTWQVLVNEGMAHFEVILVYDVSNMKCGTHDMLRL